MSVCVVEACEVFLLGESVCASEGVLNYLSILGASIHFLKMANYGTSKTKMAMVKQLNV